LLSHKTSTRLSSIREQMVAYRTCADMDLGDVPSVESSGGGCW
jgi:hypothetical protein